MNNLGKKMSFRNQTRKTELNQGVMFMSPRRFINCILISIALMCSVASATEIQDINFSVMPGDKVETSIC